MNLVEAIKERLPDDVLRQLGAQIGEGEEKTSTAISAAVPTLLSALAGLASTGQGSERLISTLKGLPPEPGGGAHHGGASAPDIGDILKKGGDILGPLLGDKLPLILTLLARFSGVGLEALKKLLGFLLPLILRTLAGQLKGQLTPGALGDLFKDQMGHITGSLPPGLSLADISGLKAPEVPARKAGMSPLVPVLAIGLVGLALWYLFAGPAAEQAPAPPGAGAPAPAPAPAAITPALPLPTADEVSKALGAVYSSASQTLVDVKDAGSADAALPKLKDLGGVIDKVKALWDRLPEDARKAVVKVTTEHIGKLKDLVAEVLQKPGVADKLKEILATLVARLSGFSA